MSRTADDVALYWVDAFTAEAFAGNPAAVCVLPAPRDAAWMQAVAREMNLSETAFVVRRGAEFELRWFTPAVEVPLCGHATLASAHALWSAGAVAREATIVFRTRRSGALQARRDGEWIELDFPALASEPAGADARVGAALAGTAAVHVARLPRAVYGVDAFLVELSSESAVCGLEPELAALRGEGAPVLIVTARASRAGCDFVSRFFGPSVGVDEDPVTGSAHCALAPYWAERLGRHELTGFQASRRGGIVGVRWSGDRVALRGQAVTIARGSLVA